MGGASAYSTLARLPDPIPSSLLRGGDGAVISTIIHELAHQIVYVPGDTDFNESFAVAVETAGARRYAQDQGQPAPDKAASQARYRAVNALLLRTRAELAKVYALAIPASEKLQQKREVLSRARQKYAGLKADWNGYSGYDLWFSDDPNGLNNALLGSVAAYAKHVPTFLALLERLNGDFPALYVAVRTCAAKGVGERVACLEGQ